MNTAPDAPWVRLYRFAEQVLDWFIEEPLRQDPESIRRARLVVAFALALALIDVLVLAMSDWSGGPERFGVPMPRPGVIGILFSIPVNISIAFVVKRTQRAERGGFFLPVSMLAILAYMAAVGEGFQSPFAWWLVAVPLFGAFLDGLRGALLSAACGTLLLVGLFNVDGLDGDRLGASVVAPLAQLRGQITLLALVTFAAVSYERHRSSRADTMVTALAELEDAHRALRFSQLHIMQIAENIGQAIWMYDRDADMVLYANTGFEKVWRRPRALLADNPRAWIDGVHAEDRGLIPTGADGKDHVYRVVLDSGETRWIRHAVYPVGGEEEGLPDTREIHIAADITLRRMAEELRERFIETVIQVQETERRHLARELHDGTGQSLAALLVGLKMLEGQLAEPAQRQMVEELRTNLRTTVDDIRRMSRGLHPNVLDVHGLVAAIRRLGEDTAEAHGIKVGVHIDGAEAESTLPSTVRLTTYRIAQEAMTNVIKHGKATEVDLSLSIDEAGVHLRVEDDGRGFDPNAPGRGDTWGSGLGLMSMRERAALLHGEVSIESAPGMGTTIIADLPLRDPTERLFG